MNKTKSEGFSAYEEIEALAKSKFPNRQVSVIASIFGNDYEIQAGDDVICGTSQTVRKILEGVKI